jgi:hypothetical protein
MGMEVLIPLLAIFSIFLVPILGLTLILTSRFAFKPLVETIANAMRESRHLSSPDASEQIRELSEQVHLLSEEVHRLREAQDFDRRLLETRTDPADGSSGRT